MDLATFQKDWQDYEVVFDDGARVKLKERFFFCLGEFDGGLGFDPGGPQGATLCIFKPDEHGDLWQRMKAPGDGPEEDAWTRIGKLERITDG